MRYVLRSKLAGYLRLHVSTLARYSQGKLKAESRDGHEMRFAYDDVDAFLATTSRGYPAPPTTEQLVSGAVVLITVEEAQALLPLPRHRWNTLCRMGKIPSVGNSHTWVRLDRAGTIAYVEGYRAGLDREQVFHIVGQNERGFKRVIEDGELVAAERYTRINHARVTRASLQARLAEWLEGIDPYDWIDQRESSEEDLLSTETVANLFGRPVDEVQALITNGQLPAVRCFGSKVFKVDPESVAAHRERAKPLSFEDLGLVFGVETHTIKSWFYRKKILACPIHEHEQLSHMYRWCLCAYLEPRCSSIITPARWISQCLRPKAYPLVTEKAAATTLRVSVAQLAQMREQNKLKAVLRPTGVWVYRSSQIHGLRYKKKR